MAKKSAKKTETKDNELKKIKKQCNDIETRVTSINGQLDDIMRDKRRTSYEIITIFALFLILALGLLIYAEMPKRECQTKTSQHKIVFNNSQEPTCLRTRAKDNMICEDGIKGDTTNENGGFIWYCGNGVKTCLYEEVKQVCDIK